MAAMAALRASTTALLAAHSTTSASASASGSGSSTASLGVAGRVSCFGKGALVALRAGTGRGPLVVVRAQVEKSSVQERSVEEKDRDLAAAKVSFQDQYVEEKEEEEDEEGEDYGVDAADDAAFSAAREEDYGEVSKILASRVEDGQTQYLIEWKDDHPESWEPADNIARDLVFGYENPWWQAAKKADDLKLKELLDEDEGRNVDSIDEKGRTALFFAAGIGSEKCVRMLLEEGADLHWQDTEGFTALHLAAGYVHTSVVKVLLEYGANPEEEDNKGRSPLSLAQDLLERTPRNNPMQFARRLALDQVVKVLDEAIFEDVAVEKILDKRTDAKGVAEYLVKWSDDSEDSWEPAVNIGEDLVKDYEEGLEYGIAERIVEKREVDGKPEYLVQWADSMENTWEPVENIADEIIEEFECQQNGASQS
ncbi:hypothetical protein KC19_3G227600 [Ceratodon purpureus]|uniref:Chromo domain-containing protein n=1 Tax=Ceratodon purpureus TaxID=3225 RepID=A0A8T0ILN4_CERPU|nr:hypothetical protein KC19_3G227600 [Ceratodon purpureus]